MGADLDTIFAYILAILHHRIKAAGGWIPDLAPAWSAAMGDMLPVPMCIEETLNYLKMIQCAAKFLRDELLRLLMGKRDVEDRRAILGLVLDFLTDEVARLGWNPMSELLWETMLYLDVPPEDLHLVLRSINAFLDVNDEAVDEFLGKIFPESLEDLENLSNGSDRQNVVLSFMTDRAQHQHFGANVWKLFGRNYWQRAILQTLRERQFVNWAL